MFDTTTIQSYLDNEGRVTVLPSRKNKGAERERVFLYVASKFEEGIIYTEKQVNEILIRYHSFGDHALLRRSLIERNLLMRKRDGSAYWKNETLTEAAL